MQQSMVSIQVSVFLLNNYYRVAVFVVDKIENNAI
jgi:hypothetical protein